MYELLFLRIPLTETKLDWQNTYLHNNANENFSKLLMRLFQKICLPRVPRRSDCLSEILILYGC